MVPKIEVDWNIDGDDVYDETNFDARFIPDVNGCRFSFVLEAAFVSLNRLDIYLPIFEAAVQRGVHVAIFVQKPPKWDKRDALSPAMKARIQMTETAVEMLRAVGVHVTLVAKVHVKSVVIDGKVLWRGSFNVLSFFDTIEEMVRKECAVECMRTIRRRRLHRCHPCMNGSEPLPSSQFAVDFRTIGSVIAAHRAERRLSQRALSERAGISRVRLAKIEAGRVVPSLDVITKILHALDREIVEVPRGAVEFLEHIMTLSPRSSNSQKLQPPQKSPPSQKPLSQKLPQPQNPPQRQKPPQLLDAPQLQKPPQLLDAPQLQKPPQPQTLLPLENAPQPLEVPQLQKPPQPQTLLPLENAPQTQTLKQLEEAPQPHMPPESQNSVQ